ncbi:MAG: hypothetical protein H7175_23040 [Burkholderiales bacterium]|nr:hypothetical protein [Anaerolineae bacterium]
MNHVRTVSELLAKLGFDAFVYEQDSRVVVELSAVEYQRREQQLRPWFQVLNTDQQSIRMIEKLRGNYVDEQKH